MARLRRIVLLGVALAVLGSTPAASSPRRAADIGLTFVDQGTVLTGTDLGLPPGQSIWGASAVLLPDGRIRLYVVTPYFGDPSEQPHGIYSAISTDGLHFTPEPGQRSPLGGGPFHVERLPDGRWRAFSVTNYGGVNGIVSAVSADGLTFTDEPGMRLPNPVPDDVLSCCGIVRLADGRYRMYVTDRQPRTGIGQPTLVYSAVSPDLFNWTLEPGVRQSVAGEGQPAALANPDGSVTLTFDFCVPCAIDTAWAANGLDFNAPAGTNLNGNVGSDPSFVTRPDGTVLMYSTVDRTSPTAGQTIGVALATRVGSPTVAYPTPGATDVTATNATVHATVDPQGAKTSYHFDYGTTTSYDSVSNYDTIAATAGAQAVSEMLTNLAPATTYHFRITAANQSGEADGMDETFTTAAAACKGRNQDRGWEVALAHAPTSSAATRLLPRARKLARGALTEQDGCTDFEVAIANSSKTAIAKLVAKAKAGGFKGAALERT